MSGRWQGQDFVTVLFENTYTFWNHLYNRQRDLFRDARQVRSVGDFGSVLARSFFHLIALPVTHGLNAGSGPETDADGEQEGWASWAAKHVWLGLVSGIPVVRDVANAISHGRFYELSPAAQGIDKATLLSRDVGRALGLMEGEPSDKWVRHAIETPGYFLGLPTVQAAGAGAVHVGRVERRPRPAERGGMAARFDVRAGEGGVIVRTGVCG